MVEQVIPKCKCGGKARYREKGEYCWIECRKCGKRTGYYPNGRMTPKVTMLIEALVSEWNNLQHS